MRVLCRAAAWPPAWVLYAACLVGTALATDPQPAVAPTADVGTPGPELIVDRADDVPNPATGLTLRAAVERAASDPRNNVIRLDSALFGAKGLAIRVGRPIVFAPGPPGRGGHDVIDGGKAGLVIQGVPGTSAVMIVRGGRLAVRGVGFAGGSEQTILVGDDAFLDLADCRVMRSNGTGITVAGRGQLHITGGLISEHKLHGIEAHGESSLAAAETIVERNGQAGLAFLDHSHGAIETCTIDGNAEWGLVVTNTASLWGADSEIRAAGFANIDVAEQGRVTLDACRVSGGVRFGVLATGGARLSIRHSTLSGNGWRGLEMQNDAKAELFDSTVEKSGHFGVVLFGRSAVDVVGGSISRNRGHGLTVRDHATADVRDSAFDENEYSGVGAPDADEGGRLSARRCVFRRNGMRPVFRGPMHMAPPVPTVARVAGDRIVVHTAPRAVVDLYLDRAGEAGRFLRTVAADEAGQFAVSPEALLPGEVMTAAATTADGHTSEFNVVAGRLDGPMLAALLARTGPLSDSGGEIEPAAPIQRWRRGTRLVFRFDERPPRHVEAYVRWFVGNLRDWLGDSIRVDVRFDASEPVPDGSAVVPIRYASATDDHLNGTGGTTFTQWDPLGYFEGPIRIFLARSAPGEEACPRVAIHEMCHALGLYHVRAGLLSRMQGIPAPPSGMINDFAPAPTFFDVAALQILYDNTLQAPISLAHLAEAGLIPRDVARRVAVASPQAGSREAQAMPATGELNAPRASRR